MRGLTTGIPQDFAMDLGTSETRICTSNCSSLVYEPTCLAVEETDQKLQVVAVGSEAEKLHNQTRQGLRVIWPVQGGVISSLSQARAIFDMMIRRVPRRFFPSRPRVVCSLPIQATAIEHRVLVEAINDVAPCHLFGIKKPLLSALGAGLAIEEPLGVMVVDLGAGSCTAAVLSCGEIIKAEAIKVGGNSLNRAIIDFGKRDKGILVGDKTAEDLKIKLANAYEPAPGETASIWGRDSLNGLPKQAIFTSTEISLLLPEYLHAVLGTIQRVLDRSSADISRDVYENGIILTGGGAWLRGLDRFISSTTGLPVTLVEDSRHTDVRGLEQLLRKKKKVLNSLAVEMI